MYKNISSKLFSAATTGTVLRGKKFSSSLRLMVAAASVVGMLGQSANAASDTWGGASNASWLSAGNWGAGNIPGSGDTATFSGTSPNTTIDLGAGVTINTILFDTNLAAAYTIGSGAVGSQALTLNNGGAITMNSTVVHNELFNAALVLGTDGTTQNFTLTNNSTTNSLTVAGGITGSTGAGVKSLIVTGSGSTALNGIIGNGATGTVSLTKNGNGTLTLGGVNTFSGGLTISSGTVAISANTALGGVSGTAGAVTINGGTLGITLGSTSMTNTHVITIGAGGGTISIGLPTSGTPTYSVGNGLLSGSGTLTISGAGTLGQAGSNASVAVFASGASNAGFTGNVNISNGGIVEFASATGIPTSGTFTVNNLGMLSVNSVTIAQNVIVNNGGFLAFQNAGTGVFSGSIALSGSATVRMQNWWNAGVNNGAITGNISGTGSLNINPGTGSGGVLTLTGTNTYTGTTTISSSTLQIGNGGATGSLSGSSAITNNGTLTINRNNAVVQGTDFSSSGITGSGAFIQAGSGTTTLNVANTFTGSTTMTAGVLSVADTSYLGGAAANNGITFNGGTLQITGTTMTGFGAHAVTYNASKTVGFDINNAANNFSSGSTAFAATDTLLKTGVGTLTLGAASNTIKVLQLNQGTLDIGSNNLAISNAGNTTINDASTSGTTTINATGGGEIVLSQNVATDGPDIGAANGATLIINANITGTSSFENWTGTNNGTGVTILNGTNDYTSDTLVHGGVLSVSKIGNQGSTTSNLGQGTTIRFGINNASTGTLLYTGTGETSNRVIDLQGTTAGGIIDASGSGLLKFTSNNTETGAGVKTLTLQGTGAGEFNGNLSGTNGALAVTKTGAGTWTLSGSNSYTGQTTVSAGTLNYSGTLLSAAQINVGVSGAGNAVMNVLPGANINMNNTNVYIGAGASASSGPGFVYQSGGTFNGGSQAPGGTGYTGVRLGGAGQGAYGYYNMSGGSLNVSELDLGAGDTSFNGAGIGVLDMSGGSMSVGQGSGNGWLIVNRGLGSGDIGILNLTGGTLTFTGPAAQFKNNWGSNGTAIINIGNATLSATNANIDLNQSNNATNFGEINLLTGGTLQANSIAPNANGTKLVNFNGGTLKASTATATFITTNNTGVNVYGNGGTIDNNGVAITIPVGLLAASGTGVNSVALSNSGTGYLGAPAVTFSGGGGTGAAGYAVVSSGTITGIVITNPGTGYTSAPTITLTGGGGSGAVAGTPALAANTSGGITFTGAGTTTLSGASTYTGTTTISSGTLQIGNGTAGSLSSSSAVTVLAPGVLAFDQATGSTFSNNIANGGTVSGVETSGITNTLSGNISGTGGLVQNGAGTTVLTGSNTYSGATNINVGTLQFAKTTAMSGSSAITTGSGATLAVNAGGTGEFAGGTGNGTIGGLFAGLGGQAGSTIAYTAGANLAVDTTNATSVVTQSTALSGSTFNFSKIGSGTLAFTGNNTFTGTTSVNVGTLSLSGSNAASNTTVANGATLQLANAAAMTGALTMNNGATLALRSDSSTLFSTGITTTIASGATVSMNVDQLTSGTGNLLTLGGTTAFAGAGTLNVSGSNGYTLRLNAVTEGGASTTQTFNVASGNNLQIGNMTANTTYNFLTFSGAGNTLVDGAITQIAGNRSLALVFNQTGAVTISGNNNLRNNSNVSDNANTYVNVNSGTTNFNSNNAIYSDFAAPLNLNGGAIDNTGTSAVTLAGSHAISIAADFTYGGTKDLDLGNQGTTLNGAAGSRTITTNGTATLTFSGAIANGSSTGLTKAGAGTLNLTGSNTYTGTTNVLNGLLKVNGSLNSASAVTVGNSTTALLNPTLGGGNGVATSGTLQSLIGSATRQVYASSATIGNIGGAVTISGTSASGSAGHLAPGNSVGTITVGSLTLSGGSILDYEFNGTANDFTVVAGALTINSGTVGINLFQESGTTQFATNGTYDLFSYGSLTGSVGNLSVLNPNGGNSYTFGTTTVSGTNYVTLTISGGGATSTTYTLTASAGSTNILTGGTTGITSTITNTGSGSADTLNYSGLGASSGTGGSIAGSTTSGTGLAQGASGTNAGLVFTGTSSGAVVVTPIGTGTNGTLGGGATATGTTSVTVNVFDPASLSVTQSGSPVVTLAAANAAAIGSRASAKVTADNGISNNQGFTNVSVVGAQINPGSSVTVASFDKTGKLNGTYTGTKNIVYDNVTASGSAISGGSGNSVGLGLSVTVSGQTAGAGQVFGAPIFSSQRYGTTTVGGTSSGYGLTSNIAGDPHSPTTALLINGIASANTTVTMSFNTVPVAGAGQDSIFRSSDILSLGGIVATGANGPDGSILTDKFVLQLSYDTGAVGAQYIGWYDVAQSQWVNAIAGNSTGAGQYFGSGEFSGSYAAYLATLSVGNQTDLGFQLGAFGYDATTHTAWAVLDHNSEFAVIPEPSTWGMILGGFGMLIGIQRLRRRRQVGT